MYLIGIYRNRYDTPVDMDAVCEAIADLMIEDQRNNYGEDVRKHEHVYVWFGTVGEAVARIHALGYATDEDDEDDVNDE